MGISGYFDGSGKSASRDTVICLAGVSAPESLWPSFERAWKEVLVDLPELDGSWHTSEARGVLGPDRFYPVAAHLLRVIHQFRESNSPSPLITYSTTATLATYDQAKRDIPTLRRLEAICVNAVIGRFVVPTHEDFPISLYFDRNEEFMKHVERVWRKSRRKGRISSGWPWQVANIKAIQADDINHSYPLQAADLIAWVCRRHRTFALEHPGVVPRGWDDWDMSLTAMALISTRHVESDHSYESIVKAYPNG
jgi:hypothetical protein